MRLKNLKGLELQEWATSGVVCIVDKIGNHQLGVGDDGYTYICMCIENSLLTIPDFELILMN